MEDKVTKEKIEEMNKEEKKIKEENKKMKEAKVCRICKDRMCNRLFLPCAHITTCELCCPACRKCPQCKSIIRGIVNIYYA